MAESLTKKTSPIKKVRFNEKVQVFIIQTENRRSTTLRNLPSDWIRFAHAKPLSEKLKEPLNRSTLGFGTGHLTPRQYRTSEDLINFYLQRRSKQPFTYWDVMKANPSLALAPTLQITREELTTPAKRGSFPTTPFPHQRRFSNLSQSTTTSPFQRRTLDKNGQFSEILAIYGNNPSLRTNKPAELLIGTFKDTQVGEVKGTIHEKLNKTPSHERKTPTSSTEIFPYFKRPQGFTQRPLKSTSYFLYK
jgi:hypothetical protein